MRQADEEVTRPPNTEADHLSTANNSQQIFSGGRGVQSREGWIGVNGVQGNHSSWPAEPIDPIDRFSRSLEAPAHHASLFALGRSVASAIACGDV